MKRKLLGAKKPGQKVSLIDQEIKRMEWSVMDRHAKKGCGGSRMQPL